jgi:hypothetical protein
MPEKKIDRTGAFGAPHHATLGGEEDGRICANKIPESVALVHIIEPGVVASMVE